MEMVMCHLFRAVLRDARGSTVVLAAMAFPVILAGAAAAVAYSGVVSTRASYQNALDGAVLAATILPMTATNGDRIKAAEAAFAGGTSARADGVTAGKLVHFAVEPVGT